MEYIVNRSLPTYTRLFSAIPSRRPSNVLSRLVVQCRRQSTGESPETSSLAFSSQLVSPQALSNALRKNAYTKISTAPRIIPVCAAWFLPNDPKRRSGRASFLEARIPRSKFFDLDEICDTSSPYPHMLPTPKDFASAMSKLGIRRDDSIVVYDTYELGIFSAPRAAWTFRVFGHPDVHILNNFRLWVDQGLPVEEGENTEVIEQTDYSISEMDHGQAVRFEEMKSLVTERNKEGHEEVQVVDARSTGRWEGVDDEPRPGLPSGHMPGSISIPYTDVLNARTKAFLPSSELQVYFETRNINPSKPIISTCGTGVTACVLDAALTEAGYAEKGRRVYDGSWTEWASRVTPEENLIATGKR